MVILEFTGRFTIFPVSIPDEYDFIGSDQLIINTSNGLLSNDYSPDSLDLTTVLVSDVSSGTLNLNLDGSFTYTSDGSTNDDSFTYKIVDSDGFENPTTG